MTNGFNFLLIFCASFNKMMLLTLRIFIHSWTNQRMVLIEFDNLNT